MISKTIGFRGFLYFQTHPPDIYHLPPPQSFASGRRPHGLPPPPAAARDPRSSPRRRPGPGPAAPGCPDEAKKGTTRKQRIGGVWVLGGILMGLRWHMAAVI